MVTLAAPAMCAETGLMFNTDMVNFVVTIPFAPTLTFISKVCERAVSGTAARGLSIIVNLPCCGK